ncbi:MAG: hypothetical protein NTX36_10430 [Proteobacteria bacterium]|nr:hypothetical protein [Pseudomonadota bacterium]
MLTKDDNGPDGRKLKYTELTQCANFDRELWDYLRACVLNERRNISDIEGWLGDVVHYEKHLIDDWSKRKAISDEIISMASKDQIVFLDPDNGYRVASCPEGRSKSCKYVYDFEISGLLKNDATIILFQHLQMGEKVDNMIRMIRQFSEQWKGQYQFAVRTSYVVYYFLSNSDLKWAIQRLRKIENNQPHTRITMLT